MPSRSRVVRDRPCLTDNSMCTLTAEDDGAFVVGVGGELAMAAAARAWAVVPNAIGRRGCRQLVLDLIGVEFFRSHGLQVLADPAAVTTQGGHGCFGWQLAAVGGCWGRSSSPDRTPCLLCKKNAEDAIARFRGCVGGDAGPDPDGVGGGRGPTSGRSLSGSRLMVTRQFEAHVAPVRDSVALDSDGADLRPNPAGAGEQGAAAPNCRGRRGCPDATR